MTDLFAAHTQQIPKKIRSLRKSYPRPYAATWRQGTDEGEVKANLIHAIEFEMFELFSVT